MNQTSFKHKRTGSRLRVLFCAALILALLTTAAPFGISAHAANGVTYKVEITSESVASGWNSATLKIFYKSSDRSTLLDIKNELSGGQTLTKTFNLGDEVPQKLQMYLDFGGGFTVRSHSGRIKFYANDEELMNEPYSARSYPFNSSDATLDFTIWGIQEVKVISPDGASAVYPTVNEAWKQALKTGGSTVQLQEDSSARGSLQTSARINFDFNGYNLTNAWALTTFIVKSGGDLSLTDSSGKAGGVNQVNTDSSGGAVRVESGGKLSVKGCTFSNCHASADGGAIHCEGSMTIENTKFISCTSEDYGGAICCTGKPEITLNGLTFEKCESDIGGGFGVYNVTVNTNLGTMTNCTFNDCKAKTNGGGLRFSTRVEILTDKLTFNRCWSEVGGGVYTSSSCPVTFNNAVFNNCTADNGGGLAYMSGGKTTLNNVEFNKCSSAECGGGLYLIPIFPSQRYTNSQDFQLESCNIHDCTADEEGGGIYIHDDGNDTDELNRVFIYKTSIDKNIAEKGGGIYVESDLVYLVDSTVTGNLAKGSYGGGIYVDSMYDINLAGEVVIRYNYDKKSQADNLCLQNGTFSSAKVYSGGLYDGSYIGVSSTSNSKATVGINFSQVQALKFLHADEAGRTFSMDNTREVSTPLFASMISSRASLAIIISGAVLIAGVTGLLIFRKRRKEGKANDSSDSDE